jgi:hypothetical protein
MTRIRITAVYEYELAEGAARVAAYVTDDVEACIQVDREQANELMVSALLGAEPIVISVEEVE